MPYNHRITTTTYPFLHLFVNLLLFLLVWSNGPSNSVVTATSSPSQVLRSAIGAAARAQPFPQGEGGIVSAVGRKNVRLSSLPPNNSPSLVSYLRRRYWRPITTRLTTGTSFQSTRSSLLPSSSSSSHWRTNSNYNRISHPRQRLSLFPFDILDPVLEPIETLWEFYTARDDIRDEMLKSGAALLKKHSVRAFAFTISAVGVAELLSRSGVIDNKRKEIIKQKISKKSKKLTQLSKQMVEDEAPILIAHIFIKSFKTYRRLPEKTKFSISMSVGGVLAKSIINTSVLITRFMIISFVTLETLAFTGVLGEPGESILEWVDDHRDDIAQWEKKTIGFRQKMRLGLGADGWNGISRVYQEAVGEEKVAFAGFAGGIVLGMLL